MTLRVFIIAGAVLMGVVLLATYEMQRPVENSFKLRPNEPASPSNPPVPPAPHR